MGSLVFLLIALLTAPLAILTLYFALELFCGLRPLVTPPCGDGDHKAVIIVPAHDEADIIGQRLVSLKAAAGSARILVVADNCTDSTADVARSLNVDVVERRDSARRGKGFALDFARRHLERDEPDVVVVIDADCVTDRASIRQLIACCAVSGKACQATNLQTPLLSGSPAVQLSTFAFYIKNVVRHRALQRLTGGGRLLGTGMAMPWAIFTRANLATASIVEDFRVSLELAEAGDKPLFLEGVEVWSNPETKNNTLAQRRRWEGGVLQTSIGLGPRLLMQGLHARNGRQILAALDVLVPPFALLLLLDICVLVASGLLAGTAHAARWPILVLGTSVILAAAGLVLAWATGGSRFVTLRALILAPVYVAWKVPLYLSLARRGAPSAWLRTRGREAKNDR